jgi:hypothetical protein
MATRTASCRSSAGDKLRSRTRPRILSRASTNSLSSLACSGQLMARVESEHIRHLLKTARSNVTSRRTKSKHYFSLSVRPIALCAFRSLQRRPPRPSLSFLSCVGDKYSFQKPYQVRPIMQTQGQTNRGSKTPKHQAWRYQQANECLPVNRLVAAHKLLGRTKRGMGVPIKAVETSQMCMKTCVHRRIHLYASTRLDRPSARICPWSSAAQSLRP